MKNSYEKLVNVKNSCSDEIQRFLRLGALCVGLMTDIFSSSRCSRVEIVIDYNDLELQVTRMKTMHKNDKSNEIIVKNRKMSAEKNETEQLTTRTVATSANNRTYHAYKIAE